MLEQESNLFFENLAKSLDISEAQYEVATDHYEAVEEWLKKADSLIAIYNPVVHPQGSFLLGTVIKPINDADEYDIDLVCNLRNLRKVDVTQKQLKQLIGDRLKENDRYQKMLEEKNRCWRLNYSDSTRFHMDILPAIPDHDTGVLSSFIGSNLTGGAILITDKELQRWQTSNPLGYAEWFKERMKVQYYAKRILLAQSLHQSVEQIPDYKVKTPLQRSIQILKRHRDVMFSDDLDDRPISIIISTLAALSYNNEEDLLDALQNIVNGMPHHIESRGGISWVPNPVNPSENFADRWKQSQRETKFRYWLRQVSDDLNATIQKTDVLQMAESLKPKLGDRIVNQAISKTFPTRPRSASQIAVPHITINKNNLNKPWRT